MCDRNAHIQTESPDVSLFCAQNGMILSKREVNDRLLTEVSERLEGKLRMLRMMTQATCVGSKATQTEVAPLFFGKES